MRCIGLSSLLLASALAAQTPQYCSINAVAGCTYRGPQTAPGIKSTATGCNGLRPYLQYDGTCAAGGSGGGGSSSSAPWSYNSAALANPPALAAFTWLNQQAGTTATQGANNQITVSIASTAALNWQILRQSVPAPPWRVAMYSNNVQSSQAGSAFGAWGLYVIDSVSGKMQGLENLYLFGSGCNPSAPGCLRVERMNSATSDNGSFYGPNVLFGATPLAGWYVGWCYDGTTVYAQISADGSNWSTLYTDNGFFAAGAVNGAGFGGANNSKTVTGVVLGFAISAVAGCSL